MYTEFSLKKLKNSMLFIRDFLCFFRGEFPV